jgi:hypothetical protein
MKRPLVFLAALLMLMFAYSHLSALTPPGPGEAFIYPSPATGNFAFLAFSMAESGQARVLVYNEAGSLVLDQRHDFLPGVQQFILNNYLFANGAYVYRVYTAYGSGRSEKMSGKFAVKHKP